MNQKIVIIGAGLCGSLLAIRLAQRGYQIDLLEKRSDPRDETLEAGRSINLALSNRGLKALDMVGLKDKAHEHCISMKGRMIHPLGGERRLSPYSGRPHDYINSISRSGLNTLLLDHIETYKNINLQFDTSCTEVDIENGIAKISTPLKTTQIERDLVIGTDGAGSAVRRSLMANTTKLLFNYSQNFLRHGYKELSIPPMENGGFRIEKNALHIWPRGSFMIIALPNMDGSFTVTMFHPFGTDIGFDHLKEESQVEDFFKSNFPSLLQYIPDYKKQYAKNPVGTLGTIKCNPWTAYGKTLIMGDAAHAIVPFYGQGMNASFEDVTVFDQALDDTNDNLPKAIQLYQERRIEDANAIADLALDNFYEMQDKVADPIFMKKRALEMQLEQKYEDYYSKYSLVTFREDLSYSHAMKIGRQQDEALLRICADKATELSLDQVYQNLISISK